MALILDCVPNSKSNDCNKSVPVIPLFIRPRWQPAVAVPPLVLRCTSGRSVPLSQRVTQLRQPTSQTTAGRITDLHVLDQRQGVDAALEQIGHCLAVAV